MIEKALTSLLDAASYVQESLALEHGAVSSGTIRAIRRIKDLAAKIAKDVHGED